MRVCSSRGTRVGGREKKRRRKRDVFPKDIIPMTSQFSSRQTLLPPAPSAPYTPPPPPTPFCVYTFAPLTDVYIYIVYMYKRALSPRSSLSLVSSLSLSTSLTRSVIYRSPSTHPLLDPRRVLRVISSYNLHLYTYTAKSIPSFAGVRGDADGRRVVVVFQLTRAIVRDMPRRAIL